MGDITCALRLTHAGTPYTPEEKLKTLDLYRCHGCQRIICMLHLVPFGHKTRICIECFGRVNHDELHDHILAHFVEKKVFESAQPVQLGLKQLS